MKYQAESGATEKLSATRIVVCPACKGRGTVVAMLDGPRGGRVDQEFTCRLCRGAQMVSAQAIAWLEGGTRHRMARVADGESIRACAERIGITPAELSAMEGGRADPAGLAKSGTLTA